MTQKSRKSTQPSHSTPSRTKAKKLIILGIQPKKLNPPSPSISDDWNPRPISGPQAPRFAEIATFSRLPHVRVPELSHKPLDVAILGIPFDGGTTYRSGARFAPRAVRQASVLCRNYNLDLAVPIYDRLKIADVGDVAINPLNIQKTYKQIEKTLAEIARHGTKTVAIGGDHSLAFPMLKHLKKHYPGFALIHFDAHTDTTDVTWGERFHHGTPMRRAIEAGFIQGKDIYQIGIRGPLGSADEMEFIKKQKINVLTMAEFEHQQYRDGFFDRMKQRLGSRPCYVTFDVDGVDPAYAPGTGTPVVGGLTSREALTCLRRLEGLQVIGGDVVEISPPYDHAEMTSLLGAAVVFEILSLIALTVK